MTHAILRHLLFTFAACLAATPALAQTAAPDVARLVRLGQTIDIIDDQGRETHGKVKVLSLGSIGLVRGGVVTQIPVERITQITRPKDGLANGALIGFGVGAGLGLLGSVGSSDDCGVCPQPAFVITSTLVMGAIGTAIGVGVDALIHHRRLIYRRDARPQARVAPLVGSGVRGGVISISW